jgi:hypothetical protein
MVWVWKLNLNRRSVLGMEVQFATPSICSEILLELKNGRWCVSGTEGYLLLYHSQLLGHKILGHEKATTMEAIYS